MPQNRLGPQNIDPATLEELSSLFARPGHVALIDESGNRTEIPAPIFDHLSRLLRLMAEQRTIVLIPEDETFTTQAAADYLGVSRQHLVDLLERGQIPFHKVGSHRRVVLRDLVAYEKTRDSARRSALDKLSLNVDKAGLYDSSYTASE